MRLIQLRHLVARRRRLTSRNLQLVRSIDKYIERWGAHVYVFEHPESRKILAEVLSIRTGDSVGHCSERLDFFHRVIKYEQKRDDSLLETEDKPGSQMGVQSS